MSETTLIPNERLASYFDTVSKRFLRDGSPEAADVEVLAPERGDQHLAEGARLIGIAYDHKKNTLELEFDSGDHRVFLPREVWVVEEPDGFPSAIEVVHMDGVREIVSVKRVGLRRLS